MMPSAGRHDMEAMRADTCYHEAAHAVFDYHAGFTIRRVYVTDELDAGCVTAVPVEPYPWDAMALAAGAFAGEIAVDRWRGERRPAVPFDELVAEEDLLEELAEVEGKDIDDLRALKMLRRAALSGLFGDLEDCYAAAHKSAERDVDDLWWPEIVAVAERLREAGYLDGEGCVRLIGSAMNGGE